MSDRQFAVPWLRPSAIWARHVQSCVAARHDAGQPVAEQEQACFWALQLPGPASMQRHLCFRALQCGDESHVQTWAASSARHVDGPQLLHEHSWVAARQAPVLEIATKVPSA